MKVKKICLQCGKEMFFIPSRAKRNKGFCSRKCMGEYKKIKETQRICPECNKTYLARNQNERNRTFCSRKCFYENRKKRPSRQTQLFEVFCAYCNKKIKRWRYELKHKRSFCNPSCQMKYYRKVLGKKFTPISFNHPNSIVHRFKKGVHYNPKDEFKKGLTPWNKDKEALPHIKEMLKRLHKENWSNEKTIFNIFRGQMFGKDHKPTELDEKIIRTRIRLFKIQHKGGETDETNRI